MELEELTTHAINELRENLSKIKSKKEKKIETEILSREITIKKRVHLTSYHIIITDKHSLIQGNGKAWKYSEAREMVCFI